MYCACTYEAKISGGALMAGQNGNAMVMGLHRVRICLDGRTCTFRQGWHATKGTGPTKISPPHRMELVMAWSCYLAALKQCA